MTTKLTAAEAYNSLPDNLRAHCLICGEHSAWKMHVEGWFARLYGQIAAEKDAEIAELKNKLYLSEGFCEGWAKTYDSKVFAMDSEIDRLRGVNAAQAAELDRLRPKPKPRKTAGEKLMEDLEDAWGTSDFPHNATQLQSLAIARGYTDDPEPPSDGELFEQACLHTRRDCGKAITHDWNESAAEFLRLRAERDGGAT